MKCPQCGVHYDDGDRECPMCGARRPAFQKDASQLARPTGELAQPSALPKRRRKKADGYVAPSMDGKVHRKKKSHMGRNLILILALIFFLSWILPTVAGVVWNIVDSAEEQVFYEAAFPYDGDWSEVHGDFWVALDEDLETYQVQAGDYTESGDFLAYENNPDEFTFPENYPPEDYTWWTVSLYPEEAAGGDAFGYLDSDLESYVSMGGYLSIFQSRGNPAEIYFQDEFDDIPWLEADTFYAVTQISVEEM